MRPSAPYLFFTCLTSDDFTCQWGSALQLNGLTKSHETLQAYIKCTHNTVLSESKNILALFQPGGGCSKVG
jgi:hypothetical protein